MLKNHRSRTHVSFISVLLCWTMNAQAHEFWMTPNQFAPAVNIPVTLSLFVGENFRGDPVAFGRPMAASLRWYSLRGEVDLRSNLPDNLYQSSITMAFDQPGAQLLALDTQPFTIELAADQFTDYLRDEGLEHVIALREATRQRAIAGRERYRRHIKTLINVNGKSDASFGVRTGQTLEILPLANPHALKPGGALSLQVLFKGLPLQGALLKAWSHRGSQLNMARTRTDAAGLGVMTIPWSGVWMLSVVHMVPSTDGEGQDWDSHWGNLTLEIPVGARLSESGK